MLFFVSFFFFFFFLLFLISGSKFATSSVESLELAMKMLQTITMRELNLLFGVGLF